MKLKIFETEYDFDENEEDDALNISIPGFNIEICSLKYYASCIRFYVDFSWMKSFPAFKEIVEGDGIRGIFIFEHPKDIIEIIPHIEKHSCFYLDRLKRELEAYKATGMEAQIERYKTIKEII